MGRGAMTFAYPVFLRIGVGVALLVVIGLLSHSRRRKKLADFLGGPRGAGRVFHLDLYHLRTERILLLVVAALALAAAAAEPTRAGRNPEASTPDQTRSVVLAIDVSASMQATDVSPTRLARAVQLAEETLDRAEGSRVGLLLFAGQGYTLAPPTADIAALVFLLRGVTPTIVSAQDPGSRISAGIRSASGLLSADSEAAERTIVLITDGEAGESDEEIEAAVQSAVANGISLHTIGVGTLRGGEMSLPGGVYQMAGPVLDGLGAPGVSRLQEPLLRRIARDGGGEYARAEDGGGLRRVYGAIEPSFRSQAAGATRAGSDIAFVLASFGLLLLLLDSFWDESSRWRKSVRRGGEE